MSESLVALRESAVKQHCKLLRLPTVAGQCARLAEQAEREHQGSSRLSRRELAG